MTASLTALVAKWREMQHIANREATRNRTMCESGHDADIFSGQEAAYGRCADELHVLLASAAQLQRYSLKFNGGHAGMFKADDGEWVKLSDLCGPPSPVPAAQKE